MKRKKMDGWMDGFLLLINGIFSYVPFHTARAGVPHRPLTGCSHSITGGSPTTELLARTSPALGPGELLHPNPAPVHVQYPVWWYRLATGAASRELRTPDVPNSKRTGGRSKCSGGLSVIQPQHSGLSAERCPHPPCADAQPSLFL
uniref:Uncharacterized protein n=1 Tax=Oryzias melastigma TaxID=30732 RepID=A0A3B3CQH6_ORYME